MSQTLESASGVTYTLPVWLRARGLQRPAFVPLVETRDASTPTGGVRPAPRRAELVGLLPGPDIYDPASASAEVDTLLGVLMDAPAKFRIDGVPRYLKVYPEDLDDSQTWTRDIPEVLVPLVAYDPYWHADTGRTASASGVSSATPLALTHDGNARTYATATVTIATGGADGFTITNGSWTVTYAGVLTAGQVVALDGLARTATLDGSSNVLGAVTDRFLTHGLPVPAGGESWTLSVNNGTADFVITHRERWY